ncbi:RtcB family protein [Emticicia fluvialis]|uniref:RtcB family protein n=1 Tax=Emticicia fluvialis TaxID=2974474 RepID=UPI002166725D|nr:RtcB family protein [Emticicia fluvialis]
METTISLDEILVLGNIPENLHGVFMRITNGLIQKAEYPKEKVLRLFAEMLANPKKFANSKNKVTNLAKELYLLQKQGNKVELSEEGKTYLPEEIPHFAIDRKEKQKEGMFQLATASIPYKIYGAEHIEEGAVAQMETAMSLPVAVAGALMPDAHQGYGLPIGGVLATTANTVIPYAVGVDIACRMCLSVYDLPGDFFKRQPGLLKKALVENTKFGMGGETAHKFDETIMDKAEWQATKIIRDLKDKAYRQLGTSGTGNHFVEWGIVEVFAEDDLLGIPKGEYLALLSHSGSRGFGGAVANYYSQIARQKTKLPKEAAHLAWLDMNTEEGQEYWIAMNLAGDYASANHHEIHKKIAKMIGEKPIKMVENHHNFAWKEVLADGTEVIVHRKGATPAGRNDLGIIPGSMTDPGFVVRGKGEAEALNSASHGAGRLMSRKKALSSVTNSALKKALAEKNVYLIGGDLDEAPMVYKNIEAVIASQTELVDVLAKFTPKIVRMADAQTTRKEGRED